MLVFQRIARYASPIRGQEPANGPPRRQGKTAGQTDRPGLNDKVEETEQ